MNSIRFSNAVAFVLIVFSGFCSLSAATFIVTNINDSGVGSLRQAILDVNSGGSGSHEIVVALSGGSGVTIFLQSELPAITNQVHLDGRDQNSSELLTIDGSIAGSISAALEINSAFASDCLIKNINIQNISGNNSVVYGILITNQAVNCSIEGCFISHIERTGFIPFQVAGIKMDSDALYTGSIECNRIEDILVSNSFGILIDGDIGLASEIEASCNNNCIQRIEGTRYIEVVNTIHGDCNNNCLDGFSILSTIARGIRVSVVQGDVNGNQIKNITTDQDFVGIITSIVEGNCSNNCVENILTIDTSVSKSIKGIETSLLNGDFSNNIVCNLTTGSVLTQSGGIIGAEIQRVEGEIAHNCFENFNTGNAESTGQIFGFINRSVEVQFKCNRLQNFSSGLGASSSGKVTGFLHNRDVFIQVNIFNNTITGLISGEAEISGEIIGIDLSSSFLISGTVISGNVISDLHAGEAELVQGRANGIFIGKINEVEFVCNTISNVSGAGEDTAINSGIVVFDGDELLFSNNLITNIVAQGENSSAHGIISGVSSGLVQNSLFEKNVINQITAESQQAYGITIDNSSSLNNTILTNSISNIDTAAIFYRDNALTDGTVSLSLIECIGKSVTISGELSPEKTLFDTDFLVQFFVSTLASPEQTKFFIGEVTIIAGNGSTPFTVTFEPSIKIFASQFVTATATALPGGTEHNLNTSVVSNVLFGCTSSVSGLCNIVSTCPNDDSLPSVTCPVLDCEELEICKE